MTLSEELKWRVFVHRNTFKNINELDNKKFKFYFGVDPIRRGKSYKDSVLIELIK